MHRPGSIVQFERLYFAALACGLANTAFGWSQSTASFAANPTLVRMMWLLPASVIVGLILRVVLWHFTARRPSLVAKWVVIAMAAVSGIILLFGIVALISGATPSLAAALAGIASGALYVAAAAYLLRPDAHAWFGEADFIEQGHDT